MKELLLLASVAATSNRTSGQFDLVDLTTYAVQVNFSDGAGDLVGSLKLQCSLDNSTWVDVSGSTQAITASADHVWDVTASGYRYFRAVWTFTSGTGNIEIKAFVKENIVRN